MQRPCVKVPIFILFVLSQNTKARRVRLRDKDVESVKKILQLTEDTIKDTEERISNLFVIQKQNSDCAPFEIGYLTYDIQEKYRRMIDKYNISVTLRPKLYLVEMVLYLEEVEQHFWEINHISSMLHEIERKYEVESDLHVEVTDEVMTESPSEFGTGIPSEYMSIKTRSTRKRTKSFKLDRYLSSLDFSTKKTTTKWWPIDYDISFGHSTEKSDQIINELSWGTKLKVLNYPPNRRVGISMLQSETEPKDTAKPDEDSSMKMKLFRLMYETVRDSDLKVKRAELIKSYYTNYSSFEIGYIFGDINDKQNIMTDISTTVKRFYSSWRPVEHINGYEQIANKAIEIAHLVDMVKVINKRRL